MKKEKSDQNVVAELTREGLYKENKWLWEENKKLKEFKTKREESMFYFKSLAERAEPINSKEAEELQKYKKLFEKLYREELYYLEEENKKLREENEELKNAMKELNNYNKFRIQENERLKSDLGECECSFGFESDEVGFWKREYKRLKKWIKDHCKGYGNLFPEDEMKRQWKKADKKRK